MEILAKEDVFDALPPNEKKVAAMLFLTYLREPRSWLSGARHVAIRRLLKLDSTAGLRRRARRALAKDRILLQLPAGDRLEAGRLAKCQSAR